MMKLSLAVLVGGVGLHLWAVAVGWAAPTAFRGPFTLNDGIRFYVVNPGGGAFQAKVRYLGPQRKQFPQPCLVRVLARKKGLGF